jgi:hypothetical protein
MMAAMETGENRTGSPAGPGAVADDWKDEHNEEAAEQAHGEP